MNKAGNGHGLSNSKKIVESLGDTMSTKSKEKGKEFKLIMKNQIIFF